MIPDLNTKLQYKSVAKYIKHLKYSQLAPKNKRKMDSQDLTERRYFMEAKK